LEIESATRLKIVLTHALYEPWVEILFDGQLKTWLLNQPNYVHHAYGKKVPKILRLADEKYWDSKWVPILGRGVMLVERSLNFPLSRLNLRITEVEGFLQGTANWQIETPDLNFLMGNKTVATMEHFLESQASHLIMSTSSSYINLHLLQKSFENLPNKKCVAGRIITQRGGKFASGAFRIFSRDVIEVIIAKRKKMDYWLPEDLAIGRLLKNESLNYIELPSIDLKNLNEVNELSKKQLENILHYRLKSGTLRNRQDTKLMHMLHKRIIDTK
jgi:hypothetical protein